MKTHFRRNILALAMLAGTYAQSAQAYTPGVYFTEVLVDSSASTFFVEITNLTGSSISLSGWGFDDSTRGISQTPSCPNGDDGECFFEFSPAELSPLSGTLSNGQSVILTNAYPSVSSAINEGGAASKAFTEIWGLPSTAVSIGSTSASGGLPTTVKLIQITDPTRFTLNTSGDELNLYNSNGDLVDRLQYFSGFAVDGYSRQAMNDDLGKNQPGGWDLSHVNDMFGSYQASLNADVGNPGFYDADLTAVPEPETYAMMLAGIGLIGLVARRRKGIAKIYA